MDQIAIQLITLKLKCKRNPSYSECTTRAVFTYKRTLLSVTHKKEKYTLKLKEERHIASI